MEIRVEWKLEWNRKSEGRENRMERQKLQKQKGKWSMGTNRMETWKEEICNITYMLFGPWTMVEVRGETQ